MNQNLSNVKQGGRFDILIEKVDRKYGFIIEMISEKNVEVAIIQMKEKEYYKKLVINKIDSIHEYCIS